MAFDFCIQSNSKCPRRKASSKNNKVKKRRVIESGSEGDSAGEELHTDCCGSLIVRVFCFVIECSPVEFFCFIAAPQQHRQTNQDIVFRLSKYCFR